MGERAVGRINHATLDVKDNVDLLDEDYWIFKLDTSPFKNWKFNLVGRFGDAADKNVYETTQITEYLPKITYLVNDFEFSLQTVFRDVDLDGSLLYKERFVTLLSSWRPNERTTHRLLLLVDTTEQDLDRMPLESNPELKDKEIEYTFIYKPSKDWSFLTGLKGTHEFDSKLDDSDWISRQVYFKIERHF